MKIAKHGDFHIKEYAIEYFVCRKCGCEFSVEAGEYYVEKGTCITSAASTTSCWNTTVTDRYICSCPECHKIVMKLRERTEMNPAITFGTSFDGNKTQTTKGFEITDGDSDE